MHLYNTQFALNVMLFLLMSLVSHYKAIKKFPINVLISSTQTILTPPSVHLVMLIWWRQLRQGQAKQWSSPTKCLRKAAVTNLANRRGFVDLCEKWRERWNSVPDGVMYDIYDGRMWREFQRVCGKSFLESSFTWCFTLNVDFFQPFSHTRKCWFHWVYTSRLHCSDS